MGRTFGVWIAILVAVVVLLLIIGLLVLQRRGRAGGVIAGRK